MRGRRFILGVVSSIVVGAMVAVGTVSAAEGKELRDQGSLLGDPLERSDIDATSEATAAAGASAPGLADRPVTTGTLALSARVAISGIRLQPCPAGYDMTTTQCAKKTGTGTVPGLGTVSMSYFFPVDNVAADCPAGHYLALATDVRIVVSGKGELTLRTAPSACLSIAALEWLTAKQEFTITAGTGIFAGASGTGTVTRNLYSTADGSSGIETWSGTLIVAGVEFDVTEPVLTLGAPKLVHPARGAKTARVTFEVTATDDKDGSLPVSCRPKSGSRFKIGRTTVRCSASDSSGNTAGTTFVVTVRRRA